MMNKKPGRHGVSKAEWLAAALTMLGKGSVFDIRINRLARALGINKSGFYWHFKNRDDLLEQLLAYWAHELTEVVTSNLELEKLEPRERLCRTAEMVIDYDLARYEVSIRQWAQTDDRAGQAVKKVTNIRVDFVSQALAELGFEGDDLEMRAMLFVCYHTWEKLMFSDITDNRRRELVWKRIELLTS
jgi:AcrR family transcriptional regulator